MFDRVGEEHAADWDVVCMSDLCRFREGVGVRCDWDGICCVRLSVSVISVVSAVSASVLSLRIFFRGRRL